MAKQDCPFCGKINIDGRHVRLCPKRPQEEAETPSEAKVVEMVVAQVATPFFEPLDEVKTLNCPTCGEKSVWLNSLDYRCPNCGDHEMRRPLPVKGI